MKPTYSATDKEYDSMLIGLFSDRESTENAYNTILDNGYKSSDIFLVMSDKTCKELFSSDTKKIEIIRKLDIKEDLIPADLSGITTAINNGLVLPDFIMTGSLATELINRHVHVKKIKEILTIMGIPEGMINTYEEGIKNRCVLMALHPKDELETAYFEKNWNGNYATDIRAIPA